MKKLRQMTVLIFIVLFLFLSLAMQSRQAAGEGLYHRDTMVFRVSFIQDSYGAGETNLHVPGERRLLDAVMPGRFGKSINAILEQNESGDDIYAVQGPVYILPGICLFVIIFLLTYDSLYERIRIIHMKDGKKKPDNYFVYGT